MKLVDGGYISWTYGVAASFQNAWAGMTHLYSRNSGTLILMDSPASYRQEFFSDYKSRRRDKLQDNDERMLRKLAVEEFKDTLRNSRQLELLEIYGLEADDLVALIVHQKLMPWPVKVIGTDKDLLQLPVGSTTLLQVRGAARQIGDYQDRLPKAIQARINTPNNVLLSLTILGDKSDSIPRLLPNRRFDLFEAVLDDPQPFQAAAAYFGNEFLRNLYVAALPAPWCFATVPEPESLPFLFDERLYHSQPLSPGIFRALLYSIGRVYWGHLFECLEKILVARLGYDIETDVKEDEVYERST